MSQVIYHVAALVVDYLVYFVQTRISRKHK